MKRSLGILAGVVLLAVGLVSCGGDDSATTTAIKDGTPEASEAELKALEDPDKVVDIKDTFMKPASRDTRSPSGGGGRGPSQGRPPYNKNRPPR